jgi:enoyl-CoA hydratase/carnithine racemase
MGEAVRYELRGPAAWITLNRPDKLNAISKAMLDELVSSFDTAARDPEAKVVVLSGEGRAFCSGYDLVDETQEASRTGDEWHSELSRDVDMTMQLWRLQKPTIAAVQGWCLGGGCELAMACDIVVASEDARFGEPEIRFGSGPVTLLMPHLLGLKRAALLLLTGDAIDAAQAERIGLVSQVVPVQELESAVERLIAKIAPTPLEVLRYTKLALLRAADSMGLSQAVAGNLDLSALLNASESPEQREFEEIAAREGLKAALRWRDSRYGELSNDTA